MRGLILAALPLVASCPAAGRALVGGSASGSASIQVGATVTVPDPPPNPAAPVDDLQNPEVKLGACAKGDLRAQLAIVNDFRDSCHEMITKGVPSPLREAEAQVQHWTQQRDAARERAHALGYRSRFRQDLAGS